MKNMLSGNNFSIFNEILSSGCLIINPSTFKASNVLIVSSKVSPFFIEELAGEKSSTLKPKDFAACSNDSLVLVLGSQNNKQTVFP